jgi:hypothetical protein
MRHMLLTRLEYLYVETEPERQREREREKERERERETVFKQKKEKKTCGVCCGAACPPKPCRCYI